MNKPGTIFVDADAFIALTKEDDSNHKRAKKIFSILQNAPVTFVTSNFVFAEVVTVLSQRMNHAVAVMFINNMKSGDSVFQIERISEDTEEQAIQIFIDQTSKNVSFVDCANIALMVQKGMDGIFSFDSIYKKNGFKIADELVTRTN